METQLMEQISGSLGPQTTINFRGDIRMSQPWRSYKGDEIFTIIRKTKSGLYLLQDPSGKQYPLKKSNINYFNKNNYDESR